MPQQQRQKKKKKKKKKKKVLCLFCFSGSSDVKIVVSFLPQRTVIHCYLFLLFFIFCKHLQNILLHK